MSELGAEAAGLVGRPLGEVGALEAAREAEVVLDPARLAGLAARGLALDHDGAQPLGRAVDGRGEPGRAAADDDEVVVVEARLVGDAEALGELEQRGPLEDRAVLEQRDRQPVVVDAATWSSSRASLSRSTSSQRAGTRLRARKSRRSCVSFEKRWPMTRTPPASSAAPASHVVSRSSTTGYSCSSGGSHGLSR